MQKKKGVTKLTCHKFVLQHIWGNWVGFQRPQLTRVLDQKKIKNKFWKCVLFIYNKTYYLDEMVWKHIFIIATDYENLHKHPAIYKFLRKLSLSYLAIGSGK